MGLEAVAPQKMACICCCGSHTEVLIMGVIDTRYIRRHRPERHRRVLLLLAGAASFAAVSTLTRADEPDPAIAAHAQLLAVTVCGTCHGPHGNSTHQKYPRLAGKNDNYLAAQLKAFRAQTRGDPDAVGYMWGMAGQLDDETIDALAQYYN